MMSSMRTTGHKFTPIQMCLGIVLAFGLMCAMTACNSLPSDDQSEEPVTTDTMTSESGTSSNTGTTTELLDDGDGADADTSNETALPASHVNLTPEMIPSVSSLPENRSVDEIKNAIMSIAIRNIPDMRINSVELLGTQMTKQADGVSDEMWASYVLHAEDGNDIGIEIICSTSVAVTALTQDVLRVSDTQSYDVSNHKYIANEEILETTEEPRPPLRNALNPDNPYTFYDDEGNLQQLTELNAPHYDTINVEDGKGNNVRVRVKGE